MAHDLSWTVLGYSLCWIPMLSWNLALSPILHDTIQPYSLINHFNISRSPTWSVVFTYANKTISNSMNFLDISITKVLFEEYKLCNLCGGSTCYRQCLNLNPLFYFSWCDSPLVGLGLPPHSWGMCFLDHTWHTTGGTTHLDEWSAHRRDLNLTTHNTHNRQTSMPPTHDLSRRVALDCAATGTSSLNPYHPQIGDLKSHVTACQQMRDLSLPLQCGWRLGPSGQ